MKGIFVALLLAGVAHADGKAFSFQAPAVRTADQQAILVFRDGLETLVIHTSYERPARQDMVVWVVPLPSVPTRVEPASRDLFLTAGALFTPAVDAGSRGLWGPGLLLFVVVSLFVWLGLQTRVGVGKVMKQTFAFRDGDKQGCTFTISKFKEDGTPDGKPRSSQVTWKQLQAHASYPVKGTRITPETIQLKAGKFECWVYTREAAGQVSRFYFAKKLPGPPVKLVVDREGKTVYSMVMVEHKPGKKVE